MSRKRKHEEHTNHEAWAIPYGDLVTLLLAFFVVMYAISTVNEGKYRVVADSLSAAFKGPPKTLSPIQVGDNNPAAPQSSTVPLTAQGNQIGTQTTLLTTAVADNTQAKSNAELTPTDALVAKLEATMSELIQQDKLILRRKDFGVEIEIRNDILFPSGSAVMPPAAISVLQRLADALKSFDFPMRVEGHTDNKPINTAAFPSNWELSAARAASVVRLFTQRGIGADRLTVVGLGEFRSIAENATEAGRNMNRRVMVIVLSKPGVKADDNTADTSRTAPPQ